MPLRRLLPLLVALFLGLAGSASAAGGVPAGWPGTLQLGVRDAEHGAADLRASGPLGLRYHYLSGGANPGRGWQQWANGGGSFVSGFVQDSVDHGFLPVFSLYQLRETLPGAGMAEEQGILANLRDRAAMRAYYEDVRVFFQKAGETGQRVVLHVEPDIWGYLQRNSGSEPARLPVQVAATGLPELAGLPDDAAGFARVFTRLRDQYAPKVVLGYHLSVWGTGEDPAYSDPSDARIDELASSSATFFKRLGANFDLVFAEFSDRDAGYRQQREGDGGKSYWDAGDFARQARYLAGMSSLTNRRIVLWQIPAGNSTLPDTNGRYRDNRVETLLGTGADAAALRAKYVAAGVIGMLFGPAIDGATCTCDVDGDGKPDDGGVFARLAAAYYAKGPIALPGGVRAVKAAAPARTKAPRMRIRATATRSGRTVTVRVRATSAEAARVVLAVQLYRPGAGTTPTLQQDFRGARFRGGIPKRFVARLTLPAGAAGGRWKVKVGVFDAAFQRLLVWRPDAAAFTVR